MYENSERYAAGREAAQYAATAAKTIETAARRAGVAPGVVQAVLQLAAMRGSGAQVNATAMGAAGLWSQRSIDGYLVEAKRLGWVRSDKGKLSVASAGRQLVADVARAWDRSARKLVTFSNALPYRRRAAKRTEDQA